MTVAIGADSAARPPAPRTTRRRRRGCRAPRDSSRSLSARAVLRLEAGRIDEDELRLGRRQDSEHAVPRRLRLARRDADARADQRIEQCRLADVGPADDSDASAAKSGAARRFRRAVACSYGERRRRLLGGAPIRLRTRSQRFRAPGCGIRRRRICTCASPLTATIAYSGTGDAPRLQPFLQLCLRILGETARINARELLGIDALDDAAADVESGIDEVRRRTPLPAHRRVSRAVAAPPLLSSPSPKRTNLPRSSASASRCSVSLLTRLARSRESSPSDMSGNR